MTDLVLHERRLELLEEMFPSTYTVEIQVLRIAHSLQYTAVLDEV